MKKVIAIMLLVVVIAGTACVPVIKPESGECKIATKSKRLEVYRGNDKIYIPTKKDRIANEHYIGVFVDFRYELFKFDEMYLIRGSAWDEYFYSVYDPASRLWVVAVTKRESNFKLGLGDMDIQANFKKQNFKRIKDTDLLPLTEGFGTARGYNLKVYLFPDNEAFTSQVVSRNLESNDMEDRLKILLALLHRKVNVAGEEKKAINLTDENKFREFINEKFGFVPDPATSCLTLIYRDSKASVHEMVMEIATGLKDQKVQKELNAWMKGDLDTK